MDEDEERMGNVEKIDTMEREIAANEVQVKKKTRIVEVLTKLYGL